MVQILIVFLNPKKTVFLHQFVIFTCRFVPSTSSPWLFDESCILNTNKITVHFFSNS